MLEVQQLSVRFGGLTALQDITLTVEPGAVVSVIGPNGAGKTTLFNVITGFLPVRQGRVLFLGHDIGGRPPNRIASLGIVRTFQKTEVFPALTVLDCVRTGFLCGRAFGVLEVVLRWQRTARFQREAGEQAMEILRFVGLVERAATEARHLSYGEQRLLEIAVGLAASPKLLLLDEPASGMNPEEALRMTTLIERLREREITILLVEHNMSVVMDISDRVAVLNHGVKIAEGSPEEVSQDDEVIRAYLGSSWTDAATA